MIYCEWNIMACKINVLSPWINLIKSEKVDATEILTQPKLHEEQFAMKTKIG